MVAGLFQNIRQYKNNAKPKAELIICSRLHKNKNCKMATKQITTTKIKIWFGDGTLL